MNRARSGWAMATEFYVPKMSDHMEEAVFVEWLVGEGDAVEEGQPILVVDTDKVVAELDAPVSGFLVGIRRGLEDGVTIPIGATVAYIVEAADEEVPTLEPLGEPPTAPSPAGDDDRGGSASAPTSAATAPVIVPPSDGPVRATPAGRKAARELGIELAAVPGSGPSGRISESDVRSFATAKPAAASDEVAELQEAGFLALTPVQKVTARRMVESVSEVPQFSIVRQIDMSAVRQTRERTDAATSAKPSVTAYLVQAVAAALVEHPRVNGFFRDGRVEVNSDVNIGVALGTSDGLYVPVVHNADHLSLDEIAGELRRLRSLPEGQGFELADLDGGTFTISNLGMLGIDEFRAIVNPPQSAILATGRVSKSVTVDPDGAFRIRDTMAATITADHRSLDGVSAAEFLASIAGHLENHAHEAEAR